MSEEEPIIPPSEDTPLEKFSDSRLDPKYTPSRKSKRLNKKAYILFLIPFALLIGAIVWGMYIRGEKTAQQQKPEDTTAEEDTSLAAKKLLSVVPPIVPVVTPSPTPIHIVAERPPVSAAPSAPSPTPDQVAAQMAAMKRQMFQNAIVGSTVVVSKPPPTTPSPQLPQLGNPSVAPTPFRTPGVPVMPGLDPATGRPLKPDNMTVNSIARFDNANPSQDRWAPAGYIQAPRSRYELRAGFIISGVLQGGINSDLPGQITARVAQDVYDGALGRYLLIPKGSLLVGEYSSNQEFGQTRVLIAWQRIVFPDQKALDLGAMVGGDSAGFSGLHDLTYTHMTSAFGAAVLLSAIVGTVSYAQNIANPGSQGTSSSNNQQNLSSSMASALGTSLGQMMTQVLQKYMSVAPTQVIRPGYRFNILVNKDLDFPSAYHAFDYAPGLQPTEQGR